MTNVHFTAAVIFADFGRRTVQTPTLFYYYYYFRILQFWNLKVIFTSDLFQPGAEVVSQM